MKTVLLEYARDCSSKDFFKDVEYDRQCSMSVVFDGEQYVPFIDAGSTNVSLISKTETYRETDDVYPISIVCGTKTRAECESDDKCPIDY